MKANQDQALYKYFTVRPASQDWRRVIAKRRPAVRPIPGLDNDQIQSMREGIYPVAHLSEYLETWSGEMSSRPIPFVSTDDKPFRTQKIYDRYTPEIFRFLLPYVKPGVQTINKVSRLGFPVFKNPGDGIDRNSNSVRYGFKVKPSKFDEFLALARPCYYGDFELYKDGVHTEGCRTQNDPPNKNREQQFITDEGTPYNHLTTPEDRLIDVPGIGQLIGSRSRIITQAPACNLVLQCWDTLLNNALGNFHLFDADVYSKTEWRHNGKLITFDCKHYERYTGLCALSYAAIVGGNYGKVLDWMINYPVIVPSDSWRTIWEVKPIFGPGSYPQFYSGLSPVADNNKLVNVAIQVAFFHEHLKMPLHAAIEETLNGEGHGIRRWNFGDDNRAVGDSALIDDWYQWMSTYFDTELDDNPTYLGTVWREDIHRWCLPTRTYVLKMFQPERDFTFKDYPNLGLVLRRETFLEYGEPEIGSKIIPVEDELLAEVGMPWIDIVNKAQAEQMQARASSEQINDYITSDKEYLMSEQQKIASGLYWHLTESQTASMALQIVGDGVRSQLSFRHMQLTPPPQPDDLTKPVRAAHYAGADTTDEEEDEV